MRLMYWQLPPTTVIHCGRPRRSSRPWLSRNRNKWAAGNANIASLGHDQMPGFMGSKKIYQVRIVARVVDHKPGIDRRAAVSDIDLDGARMAAEIVIFFKQRDAVANS